VGVHAGTEHRERTRNLVAPPLTPTAPHPSLDEAITQQLTRLSLSPGGFYYRLTPTLAEYLRDLRRTWATQLRSADVDAMVVCDWGDWNDLDTFLDHYRGTHTPEAQRRKRGKVDWL